MAAALASWNLFDLLRQTPALGRELTAADERTGAPPVVLIGSDLWRVRYGADGSVIGKSIRINGVPTTIIGVMPPGFAFPDRVEIWMPLAALPQDERVSRSARRLDGVGRLRPGVAIEQAQAELAGLAAGLAERYPDTNRNTSARVVRLTIAPPIIAVLTALLGAVGFVLLIACANVANLMLARAADRSRDVTLRVALGASRWRIVRQLLAETLLLAAAGGIAGLALSYAGLRVFLANMGPEAAPPSWVQFTVDRVVFAYLAALCVGSTLVCGLVPAWHASRLDLMAALKDAGRVDTGSRHRRRWTGAFVVALEEALAQQLWPQRVFGSMFGVSAFIALLLATGGLYAVTSYAVSRRTREIGVRVALGADARRVWWAVTGSTLRQLAIGVVLGTAGAAAIGTLLPAILVGTDGANPLVCAAVAAVLVAVGVAASAIPARRAMRLDAVAALQSE